MKETPTGLLSMDDVRCFLGDLFDAVSYMHSWGLVHRDIKPANLLLKEELWKARPVLKLADFGLAAPCAQDGSLKGWGTVPYMSPEQLLNSCNEYCDMWACGCVFAEMLLGEILVPQACWGDNAKTLKHLRSGGAEAKLDLAFLRVMCEEGGAELLKELFMFDWSSRLEAADALASPFFKGRRVRAGNAVNVARGGACDVRKAPPQFVPSPWLPKWSEEHAAWGYWRTGRIGCCHSTFEVPPFVHPVWEVCWCEEQQRFWFQHAHSGQEMYEIPRERASASAVFREILEPTVPVASGGPDGSGRRSLPRNLIHFLARMSVLEPKALLLLTPAHFPHWMHEGRHLKSAVTTAISPCTPVTPCCMLLRPFR
jgi:hypothetical protein